MVIGYVPTLLVDVAVVVKVPLNVALVSSSAVGAELPLLRTAFARFPHEPSRLGDIIVDTGHGPGCLNCPHTDDAMPLRLLPRQAW
jgi:hypothetical protein